MFNEIGLSIIALLAGTALLIFRRRYLEFAERFWGEQPALMPVVAIIVGIGLILIAVSIIWKSLFGGG